MRKIILALLAVLTPLFACPAITPPFHQAPPIGNDTSAAILIVITDGGIQVLQDPSQGPYDGIEDTLIGVQNNSGQTVFSLPLSSPNSIFGFDGDGICAVSPHPAGCPFGPTGYEGPGVSFSGINPTGTAGIVNFAGGIPPGSSAYFGLEEAIQTLCNPISGVPLLKQGGPSAPWGGITYDHTAKTISNLGCYLTSCAMLINYQATGQGIAFSTAPDTLNTWLNAEVGGYSTVGGVNPYAVAKYARAVGHVSLYCQGRVDHRDDFVVDNFLCANDPVLLKVAVPVSGHTHFVLATGQTTSGTPTFIINDPGYQNLTLAGYNFTYGGIRKFSSSPSAPTALLITGHSPIELLITDPSGNRTGRDPTTGQSFTEIPNSSYELESIGDDDDPSFTTPEAKVLDIPNPAVGAYLMKVFGTGTGPFTIDFIGYDSNANPSTATLAGNASLGSSAAYTVNYLSAPGSQITVVPVAPQLTTLGPAQVWIGLKNSDDVGTKFDLLTEVLKNGVVVGSGQLNGVSGGSSGFNNAILDTINLVLSTPVAINTGDTLRLRLSVRVAATGHRSGTARLWLNDAAANSRFNATIGGTTNSYFLRSGFALALTAGPGPKNTIDIFVDRASGGNPFKPFGTWDKSF